jgi:hypothetical protein
MTSAIGALVKALGAVLREHRASECGAVPLLQNCRISHTELDIYQESQSHFSMTRASIESLQYLLDKAAVFLIIVEA